jgi:hypothetical protein
MHRWNSALGLLIAEGEQQTYCVVLKNVNTTVWLSPNLKDMEFEIP